MFVCLCAVSFYPAVQAQLATLAGSAPRLVVYGLNQDSQDIVHGEACEMQGSYNLVTDVTSAKDNVPLFPHQLGSPDRVSSTNISWSLPYLDTGGLGLMITASLPVFGPDDMYVLSCV